MYNDLDFIKGFSKIKISTICKKLNIDKSNLWAGKASAEKIKLVKKEIINEFKKLERKEENKMEKYLFRKSTYTCTKKNGCWYYNGDAVDCEELVIFNDKNKALEYYNNYNIKDEILGNSRYCDYKELYQYNGEDVTDDMILDKDYNSDDFELILDAYLFVDYK